MKKTNTSSTKQKTSYKKRVVTFFNNHFGTPFFGEPVIPITDDSATLKTILVNKNKIIHEQAEEIRKLKEKQARKIRSK